MLWDFGGGVVGGGVGIFEVREGYCVGVVWIFGVLLECF